MFLPDLRFHSSYSDVDPCPSDPNVRVVAFAGRSNSGKSSLISALANHRNLARVSNTPGKTRLINYFRLGGPAFRERQCFLADLPGYGYARMSAKERATLRGMIDRFLAECPGLAMIVLVLDARRCLGNEETSILDYCRTIGLPVVLARSKWDKLNRKEKERAKKDWKAHGLSEISYPISSTKKSGIETLAKLITETLK